MNETTASERERLKPCPFCGAPGYAMLAAFGFRIKCTNTDCTVETPIKTHRHEVDALWNRRATGAGEAASQVEPLTGDVWLVEQFAHNGNSSGYYMQDTDGAITADVFRARRFKRQRTAELRAEDMPKHEHYCWRAVAHAFDAAPPPEAALPLTDAPELPKPAWFAVDTQGADFDITFVQTESQTRDLICDRDDLSDEERAKLVTPLYTAEQVRSLLAAAPPLLARHQPTTEERLALRDGHMAVYFKPRPVEDGATQRKAFDAGFDRGWSSHESLSALPAPLVEPEDKA